MPRKITKPIEAPVEPVEAGPEPTREEVSALVVKKRRENLKRLQAIQERLIERLESEMDGIKPRELLYNLDIANKVSTAMIDRDVPSPASQQGAQVIVNGLSREEALALISGHRESKKKPSARDSVRGEPG